MLCKITQHVMSYQSVSASHIITTHTYNTPMSLEHFKCSLHILPSCLLHCCKAGLFVALGIKYGLHERPPLRIDIIGKVVPNVLVVPVDYIVARWSFPSQSLLNKEDRWSTLMSLQEPGVPKKECQIHKSCYATASSMMVASLTWPWYCPHKLFGQFFHCSCMQST